MTSVVLNCNTKIIVKREDEIHMKAPWINYETYALINNNLSVNISAILDRSIEKESENCVREHK